MPDGNLVPVHFQVQTPGEQSDLEARMARNDARMLPEAVPLKSCIIVGSGPSARLEGLWDRLRANPDLITVACNGALSLFVERGLYPTYWTCCDPQELVLDFLDLAAPAETVYLLATKCPESLFERLACEKVGVWRLDDMAQIPGKLGVTCAVSITLATLGLMRFMGYHRFETYGWDCCYLDGEHHASRQKEPDQPMDFELRDEATDEVMQTFKTCGSWCAELRDAWLVAHNMVAMGYQLEVHGLGAVGALLRAKKLIA